MWTYNFYANTAVENYVYDKMMQKNEHKLEQHSFIESETNNELIKDDNIHK